MGTLWSEPKPRMEPVFCNPRARSRLQGGFSLAYRRQQQRWSPGKEMVKSNQKMSIFGFEGRRIPLVEEELGGAASSSWPRAGRQESVSPGDQNSMRSNIKWEAFSSFTSSCASASSLFILWCCLNSSSDMPREEAVSVTCNTILVQIRTWAFTWL